MADNRHISCLLRNLEVGGLQNRVPNDRSQVQQRNLEMQFRAFSELQCEQGPHKNLIRIGQRLATILLPNSVADDGTKRYETILSPPIRQQNSTVQNAH